MACDPVQTLNVSTVMLWMNNGCNARCITCEIWREKPNTYISARDILAHAPRWRERGVVLVELCGEPTIHRELIEICAALTASGLKFSVLSNGLRLAKFAPLIVDHAVSLTMSLDGPQPIHDRVRGVHGAFRRLETAINAVRARSVAFPVYGRCAVHRENFRYMPETVETARSLGLSSISFFGLDSDTQAFGREYLNPTAWRDRARVLTFTKEDMAALALELKKLFERHGDDFDSRFIVESPKLLSLSLSRHQRDGQTADKLSIECNAPFKSAVIEPNGDVKPCWFLPALGNLYDIGDLHDVLSTPGAVAFRKNLNVAEHHVCRGCITPRVFEDWSRSRSGFHLEGNCDLHEDGARKATGS